MMDYRRKFHIDNRILGQAIIEGTWLRTWIQLPCVCPPVGEQP